ncbi:MAG TPA: N-acetyltransferase, partial [Clostridia bacterium]|nr:N-acetyltransferase [Clostridia bacterium]
MDIVVRQEKTEDYRIVEEVVREAFWNQHVPGCDEHYLMHIMRGNPDFIHKLDMVAVYQDKIIGNIAYMKAYVQEDSTDKYEVITFGPISVLPKFQNMGVGRK